MILFGADRVPFTRSAAAGPNFVPGRMNTGFTPEFQPPFANMIPQFANMPAGIALPGAAYPDGSPLAPMPAAPSSVPATAAMKGAEAAAAVSMPAVAAAIRNGGRGGLPPHMLMALGVLPGVRGLPGRGSMDPGALVTAGRKTL